MPVSVPHIRKWASVVPLLSVLRVKPIRIFSRGDGRVGPSAKPYSEIAGEDFGGVIIGKAPRTIAEPEAGMPGSPWKNQAYGSPGFCGAGSGRGDGPKPAGNAPDANETVVFLPRNS